MEWERGCWQKGKFVSQRSCGKYGRQWQRIITRLLLSRNGWTEREIGKDAHSNSHTHTDRRVDWETHRQRNGQNYNDRQIQGHTHWQTDKQADEGRGRWTHGQTDRRAEGQKNRAVSVHTNLVIISFLASSASLCAAEAEMFPGTPTVHSTYRKGLCVYDISQ